MSKNNLSNRVSSLIANAKTKQAIELLLSETKGTDEHNMVVMQSSKFVELNRKSITGIITEEEKRLEQAQINNAILQIAGQYRGSAAKAQADSSENTGAGGTKNYLFPAITGISLLVLIMVLITFFRNPSNEQYMVYRVVLALAAGGFVAVIPGFFEFEYKTMVRAGGAMAVFAFVLWFTKVEKAEAFDFTVFVEDTNGATPLKNEGKLILKLGNDRRPEAINTKGGANFKNIPIANQNQTFALQLEAKGWQFENGKTVTDIQLKGNVATITITPDNSLCCISGSIRDEDSYFLSEVKVSIGNTFVETDKNGRFKIKIPHDQQKEEQTLTATKYGYKIWEANVYPATKQEVKIIMLQK